MARALPFGPDPERARRLDARMRVRLGESLRYVLERAGDALPVPPGMPAFLERLAAGPVEPQAFGAYYELVLAIDEEDLEGAVGFLEEVAQARARSPELEVRLLADPAACGFSRRYARLVDTDPLWPLEIGAPTQADAATTRALLASSLAFLGEAHPALAGELRALIGEVVLARSASETNGEQFDGVSCFMLWGGVVLNAGSHANLLEMVEALAHEGAHSLLFGLAVDGPLIENEDDERHASPLRSDARPVDGIYHATFVTARMHHALRYLRRAGALDRAQRDWVDTRLETHQKHFAQGIALVGRRARLTPIGDAALQGARAYMDAV